MVKLEKGKERFLSKKGFSGILIAALIVICLFGQDKPSKWDDPPKYGRVALSIVFEPIESEDLSILHYMTMKKLTSMIGSPRLEIVNEKGEIVVFPFQDYFKEVTFSKPDGSKGGFFRFELSENYNDKKKKKIINECSQLIENYLKKKGIESSWQIRFVERNN